MRYQYRDPIFKRIVFVFAVMAVMPSPQTTRADELDSRLAILRGKIQLHGLPNDEVPVVSAVAIQPNGRLVATAGDDHVVRLWDLKTGRLVRELRKHTDWVTSVAFSRDGSQIITGGRDRQVIVWDAVRGVAQQRLGRHGHPVSAIVVSAATDMVAIAGFQAPLKVFDLASGERMGALSCPCSDVRAIAFSGDARFLAAAGRNGRIRVWDLKSGTKRDFKGHSRRVSSLTFTNQGSLLSAGEDKFVKLWDPKAAELLRDYEGEFGKVLSMKLMDDSRFAVATSDNLIGVFAISQRKPLSILEGHTGSVAALDFRNHTLVSGSFDTTVRVWAVAGPNFTPSDDDRIVAPVAPPVADRTIPTSRSVQPRSLSDR